MPFRFQPDKDIDGAGCNNSDRAERVHQAIGRAYKIAPYRICEENASDLLCDLLHLCDREGWDVEEVIANGRGGWQEER